MLYRTNPRYSIGKRLRSASGLIDNSLVNAWNTVD